MKENKRQFFRMNVDLPLFMQADSALNTHALKIPSQDLVFKQHQTQLNQLFLDETHIKNGAIKLFEGVNQRLNFLVWLLDEILQGKDPRQANDFYQKLDQDRLISMPLGNGKSAVFPLIHALYNRVDELISSLLEALDQSYNGHVFLFTRPLYAPFSGERYLHNLTTLADKGNWIAQVLQNLIFKLNAYEQALTDFKAYFGDLSYPERWPIRSVNLSSGGLAVESEEAFELNQRFHVLLQLTEQIVGVQARVVGWLPIGSDHLNDRPGKMQSRHRVSLAFEAVSPSDQALITQFVTEQELASAHPELK